APDEAAALLREARVRGKLRTIT
ncbi:MAG: hypothetical protein JWM53_5277, partial [bacterium]|nr:hypothetical protein [bacterium]